MCLSDTDTVLTDYVPTKGFKTTSTSNSNGNFNILALFPKTKNLKWGFREY